MSKYVNAADAAEKIAEKHGIPLGDLVDTFAEIPAADVVPAAHGELTEHIRGLLRAEKDGRLVVLPCKVGDRVYQVIPDYTAPDNSLFIEEDVFHLGLLTDSGELPANCYFTLEAAEKALEAVNESLI